MTVTLVQLGLCGSAMNGGTIRLGLGLGVTVRTGTILSWVLIAMDTFATTCDSFRVPVGRGQLLLVARSGLLISLKKALITDLVAMAIS